MNIMIPPPMDIIALVKEEHPRLIISAESITKIKGLIAANQQAREWYERLRDRAQRILSEPPSRYEIPDGLRLLGTSRRVCDRIYTLAFFYLLDRDMRYVERAWDELSAAANFPDWNPRHFLDTAEMTHAFAIGYDWLYDAWKDKQRTVLRDAIVEKGLKPALASYQGKAGFGWWVKSRHNWNQVCNGGIGMGALAIADEIPALPGEILSSALQSLQLPMSRFAPDGAWDEGPGYWNYATNYNVIFLAALETALSNDFGLSQIAGFSEAGFFPIYITGPLGRTFNFADGGDGTIRAPQMFWLARKFNEPIFAWYQRRVASPQVLDLLWNVALKHAFTTFNGGSEETFASSGESLMNVGTLERLNVPTLPLDKYFRGVEVATFRSAWDERDAVFVGFKAGDNKANHSNLDIGSFVMDALRVRWALDLGADNYNLPEYFGRQRWNYYRMRAEGHNTLVINPSAEPDQDPSAEARILRFQSEPQRAFAIADLTPAYAKHARKVQRGIALLERKQVLVQDEILADKPVEIWWFLHTPAQAQVSDDGTTATLEAKSEASHSTDARLWAKIIAPQGATFALMDARPLSNSPDPQGQAENEGIRKLAIHLNDVTSLRLAVLLAPLRKGEKAPESAPAVVPLEDW